MKAIPPNHETEAIAAGMLTNGYVHRWVWNHGSWEQITSIIHGTKGVTLRIKKVRPGMQVVLRFKQSQVIQVTKTPGYAMPMPRSSLATNAPASSKSMHG